MSGSGIPPATSLPSLLDEEAARLRDFLVLLDKEQQALALGDIDRLLPLSAEKTELCTVLAQLGEARAKALAAAGLPPGRPGMAAWIERQPESGGARRHWQALLAMADKAKALNQTNGTLIATRLAGNQQALAVLMAAANQASLYGPDGQAQSPGSGRLLGSG